MKMKWVLVITHFVVSGAPPVCMPNSACLTSFNAGSGSTGNSIPVVVTNQVTTRSEAMERDSCFKAAELIKKSFSATVSCEVE
jgi:hypothetical protein